VALGQATAAVEAAAAITVPSAITMSFSGTAQAFQASQQGLLALLVLAIFVIYMVLGILYESFIHPATILTGLPFAAFGALLALLVFRMPLDVYGFVGLILLVGIVKKNAIMMIDFALEAERTQHITPEKAIVHAASVRFRLDGDATDRSWHGSGCGIAPPPGRCRRRGPGVLAAGNAVRDARLLHLLR
jgi:HAE1 family hydrophobic/amphiphilic exporter-1